MSLTNTLMFFMVAFMIMLLSLSLQYSHFLLALFCLEAMMLTSMLFISSMSCSIMQHMPHLSMIMLTMGACEASIGLSLMVCMSRSHGSDLMMSLSTSKC